MSYAARDMSAGSNAESLAANAILIVGAPRSGTTWLAKILDSHPDTIYRHEPDEIVPACDTIRASMALWVLQHDPRTAGKRPLFPKSWQSPPARMMRTALAYAGAAAGRIGLPEYAIPDLGRITQARAVVKSVRMSTGIGDFVRAFPDGRALLILRHPCGQVASVMRGTREGRFDLAATGTDMPFDEVAAIAFAARHGLKEPAFQRLPDAAKYAWSWREFNETAHGAIAARNNARVIVYEDLCARPMEEAREILRFTGLPWHRQTAMFLRRSTSHAGAAGYYAVLRDSIAAAGRWRTTMTSEDQNAIREVVSGSPLACHWSDLAD
jgi:hypothetical protein